MDAHNANSRSTHFNIRRQSGQSLVELAVLAVVLVPLFLLVPMVGKYIDVKQTSLQAARYAAWERTVWYPQTPPYTYAEGAAVKGDAQLQEEVRHRLFTDTRAAITAQDGQPGQGGGGPNPLWVGPAGHQLIPYGNVAAQTRDNAAPGSMYTIVRGTAAAARMWGGNLNLNTGGLYRADVHVAVNNLGRIDPFTRLNLQYHAYNVILTDAWNAGGPEAVKNTVKQMLPSQVLNNPLANHVIKALGYIAPELKGFKPGYVRPDVIPPDRLGPYQP